MNKKNIVKYRLGELVDLPKESPFKPILCQNRNGLDYCGTCGQAWKICSCTARNTGFNFILKKLAEKEITVDVGKIFQTIDNSIPKLLAKENKGLMDIHTRVTFMHIALAIANQMKEILKK